MSVGEIISKVGEIISKPWFYIPCAAFIFFIGWVINKLTDKFLTDILTNITYVGAAYLSVVGLAALVGASISRIETNKIIDEDKTELNKKFKDLSERTNELIHASENISNLPKQCEDCLTLLKDSIDKSERIMPLAFGIFHDFIINYDDMKKIEESIGDKYEALKKTDPSIANKGEIWVMTSGLRLEHNLLKDIIPKNLKKGITYKYLLPKGVSRLHEEFEILANEWRIKSGLTIDEAETQIKLTLVPNHLAYMIVIIYEPVYHSDKATVLIKFPTYEKNSELKYPFIFRVAKEPDSQWQLFVDSLHDIMNNESKHCEQVRPYTIKFK